MKCDILAAVEAAIRVQYTLSDDNEVVEIAYAVRRALNGAHISSTRSPEE